MTGNSSITPLLFLRSLSLPESKHSLASLDGTETVTQSTVKYVAKARESAVKRMRNADRDDVFDDDKEETEDEVFKDEFFQWIVKHTNGQTRHAYKLSYANEIGSSLDPHMVDVGAWEAGLQGTITSP
ncbi:hypothetical protein IW262DRAFT_1292761 [Armillaria fumosa]|nr:hypothetical protein IW262DRAFT_1292761 [Armillaria fumosa]